jgi:uncharacterized protein YggT (Ycf19 family)
VASTEGFWIYQLPNLVLAALMYTLLGRLILSLLFEPNSDKVIWRVFAQVTDPVVGAVAAITPRVVPDQVIVLFAVVWTFLLRILLFFVLRTFDLIPSVAP